MLKLTKPLLTRAESEAIAVFRLKKTREKARRFSGRTTMLWVGGWLPKIDLTAIK